MQANSKLLSLDSSPLSVKPSYYEEMDIVDENNNFKRLFNEFSRVKVHYYSLLNYFIEQGFETNLENKKALRANKFFNLVSGTIKYFYKNKPSANFLKDYGLTTNDVSLMTELAYLQKLDDKLKEALSFSDIIYHFDASYDFKSSGKYIDIYGHKYTKHFLITDKFSNSFITIPAFENERDKLYLGTLPIDNVGVLSDKMMVYLDRELLNNITSSGHYSIKI